VGEAVGCVGDELTSVGLHHLSPMHASLLAGEWVNVIGLSFT